MMVQDDIIFHMLMYAKMNRGIFKKSSFKYIADPPRTWRECHKLLDKCVDRGYFQKTRPEGRRAYIYLLTLRGYAVLELGGC